MANGNGYKTAIAVVIFVVTLLGSFIGVYNTFHAPLREAIAAEIKERTKEDKDIREDIRVTSKELLATLSDIRAQIARIETKMDMK